MVENVIIQELSPNAKRQFMEIMSSVSVGGSATQTGQGSSGASDPQAKAKQSETKQINDGIKSRKAETFALKDSTEAFKRATRAAKALGSGFLNAAKKGLSEYETAIVTSAEASTGLTHALERQTKIWGGLGVSVEEFDKFSKSIRGAELNLGGYDNLIKEAGKKQEFYQRRLGNFTSALEHQQKMINAFTHSGLDATDQTDVFGKTMDQSKDRLWNLGVSYQESTEYLEEMLETEGMRQKLLGARDKEHRMQIILETQARFENLKMMGFQTEKAKMLAKRFEEMGGQKALTRFQKAAKEENALRAMRARGMIDMSEQDMKEFRRLKLKGKLDDKESKKLRAIYAKVEDANAKARMKTAENIDAGLGAAVASRYEMAVQKLSEPMEGAFKDTSDKLNQGAAVTGKELAEATLKNREAFSEHTSVLHTSMQTLQKGLKWWNESWTKEAIMAPLSALTAAFSGVGGSGGGLMSGILGGLAARLGIGAITGAGAGAAAGAGAGAGAGAALAAVAVPTIVAGVTGAVSYGVGKLVDKGVEALAPNFHRWRNEMVGGGIDWVHSLLSKDAAKTREIRKDNLKKMEDVYAAASGSAFERNKKAAVAADKTAEALDALRAAGDNATKEQRIEAEQLVKAFHALGNAAGLTSKKQEQMLKVRMKEVEVQKKVIEEKKKEAQNIKPLTQAQKNLAKSMGMTDEEFRRKMAEGKKDYQSGLDKKRENDAKYKADPSLIHKDLKAAIKKSYDIDQRARKEGYTEELKKETASVTNSIMLLGDRLKLTFEEAIAYREKVEKEYRAELKKRSETSVGGKESLLRSPSQASVVEEMKKEEEKKRREEEQKKQVENASRSNIEQNNEESTSLLSQLVEGAANITTNDLLSSAVSKISELGKTMKDFMGLYKEHALEGDPFAKDTGHPWDPQTVEGK